MNLENLFTLRIVSENGASQGQVTSKAMLGPAAAQDKSFFDLFLAQISSGKDGEGDISEKLELLKSDNPTLEDDPKLDIAKLLAANEDIEEELEAYGKLFDDTLPQVIALNQKAFDEIIKPLQEDGKLSFDLSDLKSLQDVQELNLKDIYLLENQELELSNKIRAIIEKIDALASGSKPQLIITNLTPDDLAALKDLAARIEAIKDGNEDALAANAIDSKRLEDVLAGLVNLVQKAGHNDNVNGSKTTDHSVHALGQGDALSNNDAKSNAEKLARMMSGSGYKETNAAPFQSTMSKPLGNVYGDNAYDLNAIEPKAGKTGADAQNAKQLKAETAQNIRNAAGISIPATGFSTTDGLTLISTSDTGSSLSELVPLQQGFTQAQSMQANTSNIMLAQGAHAPHPTTQAIAATLKSAAAKGQDTQISIQLDPPDLGRVDIEMRFNKENSVKAILTVEKPETLAMFQRDAHALERALQDAGLELGGDALSFDLAGEGYDFNHNGKHDGQGPHGRGGVENADEKIITLETTMDWYVDPETGHTRYDIYA